MLAITIVLFVVPHNQQIVTIQQFFTYRIPLFRNQNLNIRKKLETFVSSYLFQKMVGTVGLEPTRDFSQRILSPLRLPIPPRPHVIGGSDQI